MPKVTEEKDILAYPGSHFLGHLPIPRREESSDSPTTVRAEFPRLSVPGITVMSWSGTLLRQNYSHVSYHGLGKNFPFSALPM